MPALSKKQQKFMGIVRSIQKGEQPASKFNKDAQDVAKDMKKTDVKKFASTKHKGLPMKKEILGKLKEMIKQELSEYTYGSGDIVKDVNPTCPHYGAQGKVKSVGPKSVVFVVMNKGKNFKPGMELEKSHDQMKKIGESINEADARNDKSIGTKNYKGVGWFWPSDSWKHYLRDTSDKGRKVVHDLWLKAGFEIKKNNRGIPGFDIKSNERNKAMKIVDMINKRMPIKESMNPSAVKKMRDEFEKTGQLPPHLKRFALDLKILKKKHKVKNIVVPGLEWMSDMKEQSVNEAKYKVHMRDKKRGNFELEKFQTGGQSYDYKKGMDIVKKLRKMSGSLEYKLVKESVNEARLDPKQLLQQLGGNRFITMTGAKNLAIDKPKNELHMKIGRNAKGVSHVRIRLSSMDLYDMEFLQVRAGKIKIKSKEKGVYADQLGKMFKKNTGMNVRL